jgi:hypothetical protein
MTLDRAAGEPRTFSITRGPYLRLLGRLHLVGGDGTPRVLALVLVAWLPFCVAGLLPLVTGGSYAPILRDISIHSRLLIGLPLLIEASRILEQRCASVVAQLYAGHLADPAQLDPIVDRAERLRHSRLVELAIIAVVIGIGQAAALGGGHATGLFGGEHAPGTLTFARAWYTAVALPLLQFLYLDWLWQWVIWSILVIRVARLPLATNGIHPDGAAGLELLDEPLAGYAAFTLAGSTMMASAWGSQVVAGQATPKDFVIGFVVFVLAAGLIACGPLLTYMPMLYRARFRDRRRYGLLALDYVRGFDDKWIAAHPEHEDLLGSADIQSLNDMIGSAAHAYEVRLVPFTMRALLGVWVAAVVPMLPLAAAAMPAEELIKKLAGALVPGLD